MIRLLGVITGSTLAVATLLLVIGVPRFQTETAEGERTPVRLPRPTLPVEEPRRSAEPDEASEDPALADTGTAPPDPGSSGEAAADSAPARTVADDASDLLSAQGPAAAPDAMPTAPESWHVFWSPFKSRVAAEGFVARLQSVTGLDYRIVKREPGAYEVSFAYADSDELGRHLSQISAATGLDLAEAR